MFFEKVKLEGKSMLTGFGIRKQAVYKWEGL
jgi:hypothetical protein